VRLPGGWDETTIGKLIGSDGIFVDGDWIETKDQDPDGDVRLIQLADIGDGIFLNRSRRFMNLPTANKLGCTYLREADLLVARMPDPLGRAAIFPGDARKSVTAVDVCIIRTGQNGADHRWLMSTINSPAIRRCIAELQSGTTRKRISRGNLATIKLPTPPSAEQKRIVAEIEKQFTRLDAAMAALKRVQANLKRYRSAVLKAACGGRLVPTEAELARKEDRTFETGEQLLVRVRGLVRINNKRRAGRLWGAGVVPELTDHEQNLLPPGWTWAKVHDLGPEPDEVVQVGPMSMPLTGLRCGWYTGVERGVRSMGIF
jgi:type I restriction enzyme S subunit